MKTETKAKPDTLALPLSVELPRQNAPSTADTFIVDSEGKDLAKLKDPDAARLIVTACNSHDALLRACEAALELLEFQATTGSPKAAKGVSQIQAALALAHGEKGGIR